MAEFEPISGKIPEVCNNPEKNNSKEVTIRPYNAEDISRVMDVVHANFNGISYSLFPQDVVNAYKAANSKDDITHAIEDEGTQTFVAETQDGELGGFALIRHHGVPRRNAYGDLDLRRMHVNPNIQGNGIGKKLFNAIEERGRELNVSFITSHASGGARNYFEKNGWTGKTILNHMSKRNTSSLVFATEKSVWPEQIDLYLPPTHVIYAGSNPRREEFLHQAVGDHTKVMSLPSVEDPSEDVVVAAQSKALSLSTLLRYTKNVRPVIIGSDIRTDLVAHDPNTNTKYHLENRGKPKSVEEARENFKILRNYAQETDRPAPYIVRSATYIHDPLEPDSDSVSEYDVSLWLSQEALEELSSEKGFAQYREQLHDEYGQDVTDMAAGFALPIFIKNKFVEGINGYPLSALPKSEKVINQAYHTVLVGIEDKAIKKRFGIVS